MKPSWTEPSRWEALVDGSGCPFCLKGPSGVIVELPSVYVTVQESVAVRGYCCLVLRRHAVELHGLTESQGAELMRDIQRVSGVVQSITGAIKLNYEIHGNIMPHVHVHIVPRYPGDAMEVTGKPFAAQSGPAYGAGEFAAYTRRLQEALRQDA